MAVALIIVIGVLVVGGAIVFGYYARKRRIQEWQQTAGHLGFQYSTEDPFDLLGLPFDLFRRGDGRGVENVVWGQRDGLDIKDFEYWYYQHSSDAQGHTNLDYSHVSCTVVPTAVSQFATYLVDARMMQWLLDNKGWHFELCGRWVLAYGGRTKPKLIWGVIEAAREFHQHIPKVIDETYREGS
ncbi:MAG: hypothetical protein E6G04_03115 [Actinobacteria bacterium]|nr:MAG: hypothetical protein E6G04_03115 [Actinomycetota bacterium]